jgi:redox-sensitive bicupin YhaK (pirin superfamily)
VIETRIPIQYLHFRIEPGGSVTQPVPRGDNAFAYVLEGEAAFGEKTARAHQMAVFNADGDSVTLPAGGRERLGVLLLSGTPLHEPVSRWGPFVMNTKAEIVQAIEDYQSGRMGTIAH